MEIRLSWEEYNPTKILLLLKKREFLEKDQQERASQIINGLRRILPTDKQTLEKVRASIETRIQLSDHEEYVKRLIVEAKLF
jgi:hypothetical protein